jgi:hypothetical protein
MAALGQTSPELLDVTLDPAVRRGDALLPDHRDPERPVRPGSGHPRAAIASS